MRLIVLTLSLVCFILAATPFVPEPHRFRLAAAGAAFYVLAQYPFPG